MSAESAISKMEFKQLKNSIDSLSIDHRLNFCGKKIVLEGGVTSRSQHGNRRLPDFTGFQDQNHSILNFMFTFISYLLDHKMVADGLILFMCASEVKGWRAGGWVAPRSHTRKKLESMISTTSIINGHIWSILYGHILIVYDHI